MFYYRGAISRPTQTSQHCSTNTSTKPISSPGTPSSPSWLGVETQSKPSKPSPPCANRPSNPTVQLFLARLNPALPSVISTRESKPTNKHSSLVMFPTFSSRLRLLICTLNVANWRMQEICSTKFLKETLFPGPR